ncbi:MAG: dihydrofolate reductase [bacterium]
MKKIIVVAYGQNWVIGKDGKLAGWKLPTDLENFKELTTEGSGHALIMGKKTYMSLPRFVRPLPGRDNIVLSRTVKNVDPHERVFTRKSLKEGVEAAEASGHTKCFIIGGGEIYSEAILEKEVTIDEIIATEISAEFEGDTFFPVIDRSVWRNREILLFTHKSEKDSHDFEIVRYTK